MLNANVLPGLTLTGKALCAVAENDPPVTPICEITTGADPWLTTEMLVLADWPIGTEPNATVVVEALNQPVASVLPDELSLLMDAVQPERRRLPKSIAARRAECRFRR